MGLFNLFKKNADTFEQSSAASISPETTDSPESSPVSTEPSNWAQRLEDVKRYISEAEGLGLSVKPEDVERIMQTDYAELIKYANGNEQFIEQDLNDIHQTIEQILQANEEKYPDKGIKAWLRSRAVKISFATLMLFLKFAPHAQAHGPIEKLDGGNNLENSAPAAKQTADSAKDNTYQAKAEEFMPTNIENVAMMDLSNSYETDKDAISPEDADKIKANFRAFLAKIGPANYKKVSDLNFKIYGSSDERPTNAWKGGNLELTQARIAAAEKILTEELQNYDFSASGLSPTQIDGLVNKKFQHGIPDQGETKITDLLNPETGQNYSASEVALLKKNNQIKYHELLSVCRYIKVNLLAKADELAPMPSLKPAIETGSTKTVTDRAVDLIPLYDQTVIIFDNSPSMVDSKNYMGDQLQSIKRSGNIQIAAFSDKLDFITSTESFEQAGQTLKSIENKGNSHEQAVSAALEALNAFSDKPQEIESKLMLVNTDEAIQTTKQEMDKLLTDSQAKGVKVYFLLGYDRNHQILKISLEEMAKNLDSLYEKKREAIQSRADKARAYLARDKQSAKQTAAYQELLLKSEKDLQRLASDKMYIKDFILQADPGGDTKKSITMNIYD